MPHRRRSLLRCTLGVAPAALILVAACSPGQPSEASDSTTPAAVAPPVDPAADLDREFQRARTELNSEATNLATLDRSSREYATRYDAFVREAAAAESLLLRRDSVRRSARTPAASP